MYNTGMSSVRKGEAKIVVANLSDLHDDKVWWQSQSVSTRLQALLQLRKIVYGDAVTGRLQRVLKITELK